MARKLVIVESPSKAKTIEKILGRNYEVVASYGHVIDLPKTKIGIDVENNFEPQYKVIKGKGEILKKLKERQKRQAMFIWLRIRTGKGKPLPGIFQITLSSLIKLGELNLMR